MAAGKITPLQRYIQENQEERDQLRKTRGLSASDIKLAEIRNALIQAELENADSNSKFEKEKRDRIFAGSQNNQDLCSGMRENAGSVFNWRKVQCLTSCLGNVVSFGASLVGTEVGDKLGDLGLSMFNLSSKDKDGKDLSEAAKLEEKKQKTESVRTIGTAVSNLGSQIVGGQADRKKQDGEADQQERQFNYKMNEVDREDAAQRAQKEAQDEQGHLRDLGSLDEAQNRAIQSMTSR